MRLISKYGSPRSAGWPYFSCFSLTFDGSEMERGRAVSVHPVDDESVYIASVSCDNLRAVAVDLTDG